LTLLDLVLSCKSALTPYSGACSLTKSPVVQMHIGKDENGQPLPIIGADDVARSIAFLASDEAKMVNGALLPIDAAWSTI
jgi:NAD(P)-dependent dehydrogenase (short-subunit alcohol dehydrogenase family)